MKTSAKYFGLAVES